MNAVTERALLRKVSLRLLPFLFVLYIVAYLDRANVGFAKLQFAQDLKFSESVFGFGAGIFFFGYFLFEIPSNLLLEKVGARKWIARIMVTWGLLAMAMMFTHSALSFYILRFLLGVAEAGFFPGVILYLTYWFISKERAKMVALFMTAATFSNVIGGPISGELLKIHWHGLAGWQWLFILEGVPAVLLGVVVLFYLPDGPEKTHWITDEEREFLIQRRQTDRDKKGEHDTHSLKDAIKNPLVWRFCLIYFMLNTGSYSITFFLPQIIKTGFHFSGTQTLQIGLLNAIPFLAGTLMLVLNGWHSDKSQERRFHVAGSALLSAGGFFLAALLLQTSWPALIALMLAAAGIWGMLGPFWAMPTGFLRGTAAAGGIALINSVGNLGGFLGPWVMGFLKDKTQSYTAGLIAMGLSLTISALLAATVHATVSRPRPDSE